MSSPLPSTPRLLTILFIAAFLGTALLPLAAAQVGGAGSALGDATAAAQQRSVGTYDVKPVAGQANQAAAQGALTSALISESSAQGQAAGTGVIKDFSVNPSGSGNAASTVFSSIDAKGFTPTSRLEGVGTSALSLRSDSLVITMTDAASGLLAFKAVGSDAQQIVFNAAGDVVISASATASNVWNVKGGASSGALILIGSKGEDAIQKGSSLQLNGAKQATASLKQGTQLIYRANTAYGAAADQGLSNYNEVALKAIATGHLAGEATSEFSTGVSLIAQAQFQATASLRTEAKNAGRVVSQLKGAADIAGSACASASGAASGAGSAASGANSATGSASGTANANACAKLEVVAYDFDYVDVPAQTADQVAVYVDGALAQRVDAASSVAANADSYWATTVEGRVMVLTNVAAKANAATTITIAALAQGEAAASTLAELDAQSQVTSELSGGFQLLGSLDTSAQGSGQVVGKFGAFFANEAKGDASARDFTDVRSSTDIFTKISFAADAAADATASFTSVAKAGAAAQAQAASSASGSAAVKMVTSVSGKAVATAEFSDDVYSSIEATADAATLADFSLGNEINARAAGDVENVIALDGPAGQVGHLIITKADGSATSASHFDVSAGGHVKAILAAGDKVSFRGATEAQTRAGADATAEAIAKGQLTSETSVGFVANAIANANVDYKNDVHTSIDKAAEATHKGVVTLDVVASAAAQARATVVTVVADRATLAAQSASDIKVTVDGKAAALAQSSAQVFAAADAAASASGTAQYFVETSLQGQTRIITSIPSLAGGATSIVKITSVLDSEASAKSAVDSFGSFKPGYGGVATGDIVSLVAKPDAGLILDYTVIAKSTAAGAAGKSTQVFDAVKVGSSAFASASASTSNSIRFANEQAILEAFDVSAATMKIEATANTVAKLDLADNVKVEKVSDNVVFLKAPDFTGALILTQAASAAAQAGGSATSKIDTSAAANAGGQLTANLAAGSQLVFKAFSGFEAELSSAQQQAQANAIASGKLLGQVIVSTQPGASATTTSTANLNYYSDVKAVTSVASADKVEVLVDSASSAGKTIILSFDRNTVAGLIDGKAKLLVDGKTVTQAKDYADAFNADGDKYLLLTTAGEVGLQAIVTLSHFSTRTITIETPAPPSIFLWTTVGLGVVVLGQAVYPRLKRKW